MTVKRTSYYHKIVPMHAKRENQKHFLFCQ